MNLKPIGAFFKRHQAVVVWVLRIALGALFIVSGLSKAIDVSGTIFKIEEYLIAWNIDLSLSIINLAAILLAGSEFVAGVLLATGCFKRTCLWYLLLLMSMMLPLSLYIWIANPVSDCGCFGDFWKISNAATFWKNVAITIGLAILACYNRRVNGIYPPFIQWIVTTVCSLYALYIILYGMNIQPLVDFRSFAPGTSIITLEEDSEEVADFTYTYKKDGVTQSFSIDNLPDSTWQFVGRESATYEEERSDITELNLFDTEGNNVTAEAIAVEGEELLIVIPDVERAGLAGTYAINELQRFMEARGGSMVELISIAPEKLNEWRDYSMATLPIYLAEETTLKELTRGDMSVVMIKDGIIRWKRTLSTIDVPAIVNGEISLDEYEVDGEKYLLNLSLILAATLAILLIMALCYRFFNLSKNKKASK